MELPDLDTVSQREFDQIDAIESLHETQEQQVHQIDTVSSHIDQISGYNISANKMELSHLEYTPTDIQQPKEDKIDFDGLGELEENVLSSF